MIDRTSILVHLHLLPKEYLTRMKMMNLLVGNVNQEQMKIMKDLYLNVHIVWMKLYLENGLMMIISFRLLLQMVQVILMKKLLTSFSILSGRTSQVY